MHEEIIAQRRFEAAKANVPVAEAIKKVGGTVLFIGENTHAVIARIPLDTVNKLAERKDVAHIALSTPLVDDVDGSHVIAGHQIAQFIDDGYNGENISDPNEPDTTFAQVEGGAADDEHLGFKEDSGSSYRIRGRYNCDSSSCVSTSNFSSNQETDHATAVAGQIFGDLRDGQDPGVSSSPDRIARSGYAGESRGWLFRAPWGGVALDYIAGMTGDYKPVVVNMSASGDSDSTCLGQDAQSVVANEIYESGKLLFNSGGNLGHSSATDCTVQSPGSALGVFMVGGLGDDINGDTTTVREATIGSYSPRGGTSTEGGNRTIIDLTAYGCRDLLFDKSGTYSYDACGTSRSTPTVTATAIDIIDFFKDHANLGDISMYPGLLHANLLLMGDRYAGGRLVSGYSSLYGAGRLRAREWDDAGLDSPFEFLTGTRCVGNNQTVTITVNGGNTISNDVNVMKAVIWWYDPRHEVDGTLDDIDLLLKTTSGTKIISSINSYDEKERVVYDVSNLAVKLEIKGYSVTGDDTGCGTNSMKVYYAYYFEDTDRDDTDGPGSEIEEW